MSLLRTVKTSQPTVEDAARVIGIGPQTEQRGNGRFLLPGKYCAVTYHLQEPNAARSLVQDLKPCTVVMLLSVLSEPNLRLYPLSRDGAIRRLPSPHARQSGRPARNRQKTTYRSDKQPKMGKKSESDVGVALPNPAEGE